jgi:hypothetical protein
MTREPIGSNLLAARNRRELSFPSCQNVCDLLKPNTLSAKSHRFAVSFRTTKISAQNHRQKIGARLMPNEKS